MYNIHVHSNLFQHTPSDKLIFLQTICIKVNHSMQSRGFRSEYTQIQYSVAVNVKILYGRLVVLLYFMHRSRIFIERQIYPTKESTLLPYLSLLCKH